MKKVSTLIALIVLIISCTTQKKTSTTTTVKYKGYRIENKNNVDTAIVSMLAPYSKNINSTMNTVIGFSTRGLTKKQPESELGNFMADCMKEMAANKFNTHIDAAFVNYGGIRSYIPKGDITIGKIYELMPFDNLLVIQNLKGSVFRKFIEKICERGGWPVSGITMKIKDKKPIDILIDGKPLNDDETYIVANSDYIANGGDDCEMLKGIPALNNGFVLRDIIIEFIQLQTKKGNAIDWKTDGRVTY